MELSDLIDILEEFGIETQQLVLTSTLGADAGMDSQEIVELRDTLNRQFAIALPERSLKKASTLENVLNLVRESQRAKATSPDFAGRCETSLIIGRSVEVVYDALFDLSKWTRHLQHVEGVEVLYDDGTYQEFTMDVRSPAGLIHVRSIRRCELNQSIEFFQPMPPPFLKHHSGGWRFDRLGADRCLLSTYHKWNVEREAAAEKFGSSGKDVNTCIEALLLEHAKLALESWQRALEAKAA